MNDFRGEESFQIHLISLSRRAEKLDVINDADYIINDEQIEIYDWQKQMIVLSDDLLELYKADLEFLNHFSLFAIVWNGEVVAEGNLVDLGSPYHSTQPVMHVLEPVGDPQFPESSSRLFRGSIPEFVDVKDLSILLRPERTSDLPKKEAGVIFTNDVSKEIRDHFKNDGRLLE